MLFALGASVSQSFSQFVEEMEELCEGGECNKTNYSDIFCNEFKKNFAL